MKRTNQPKDVFSFSPETFLERNPPMKTPIIEQTVNIKINFQSNFCVPISPKKPNND